jgi:RHS repeat-associated protein
MSLRRAPTGCHPHARAARARRKTRAPLRSGAREHAFGGGKHAAGVRVGASPAGGIFDKETGLTRFGARDYDAASGRWVQKDASGLGGGANLYRYATNDPINEIDVTGRDPLSATLTWFGAAGATEGAGAAGGLGWLGGVPAGGLIAIGAGAWGSFGYQIGDWPRRTIRSRAGRPSFPRARAARGSVRRQRLRQRRQSFRTSTTQQRLRGRIGRGMVRTRPEGHAEGGSTPRTESLFTRTLITVAMKGPLGLE